MSEPNRGKSSNVRRFRKPLNINIGIIIFASIFIYIFICIILFSNQKHIQPHEVKEGSLATNKSYRGVVIRNESVVTSDRSGYVNYFAREGERVACGNLVYTLDESDRLSELMRERETDNGPEYEDTSEFMNLRTDIVNFAHSFTPENFSSVYDFKYSVAGAIRKISNAKLMDVLNEIDSSKLAETVYLCRSPISGMVMYWTDGYEDLTPETVTEDVFNNETYEKNQLLNNELLANGDVAYKLCTDEEWSVVIPVEPEWGRQLEQENYIKVCFQKNQEEAWGKVKFLQNSDGNGYLQLTFQNSMISFISDRFVDLELLLHDAKGLKIPNSSIVEKEFLLIPEDFILTNDSDCTTAVLKETILENGTQSTEYLPVSPYSKSEEDGTVYYYVDDPSLKAGDRIYMEDSSKEYIISRTSTLVGVYNINKGYADFRRIIILYQNDEYSIVQSNTDYGLNVYDFIALDASTVNENDFIYE